VTSAFTIAERWSCKSRYF